MRTPAGKECPYFFGDYYRGRNHEECRLLAMSIPPQPWKPELCNTCPVPEIVLANACPFLQLSGHLERTFPLFKQKVVVKAYCDKTHRDVKVPEIGCGECHPLSAIFTEKSNDSDPSA